MSDSLTLLVKLVSATSDGTAQARTMDMLHNPNLLILERLISAPDGAQFGTSQPRFTLPLLR